MSHWDGYDWVEGEGDGRVGGWIQTFTGRKFHPLDPRLEDIDLLDIGHALSNQCRFSGHCRHFYSVAQHSVLVSRLVADRGGSTMEVLWGLLHDAPEAYLVDLPRPIKHSDGFGAYQLAEQNLMRVVCRWAGALPFEMPDIVEEADKILLATERRDLLGADCHWEVPGVEPLGLAISQWPFQYTRDTYISRANTLRKRLAWEVGVSA